MVEVPQALHGRMCSRDHTHAPALGSVARASTSYTSLMARILTKALARPILNFGPLPKDVLKTDIVQQNLKRSS